MYRSIDSGTWDDPWFSALSPKAKLLFFYLITNRRSTSAGAFEITLSQMAFETGLGVREISALLNGELEEKVQWWPGHQIIWVKNFYRRQRANTGPSFEVNARKCLAELPTEVQDTVTLEYPELAESPDTLSGGYGVGMGRVSPSDEETSSRHNSIPTPYPTDTHGITAAAAASSNSKQQAENSSSNVAHAREKPPPSLYAKTLNGALPTLETIFEGIDRQFNAVWLGKELAAAGDVVGPLSREQLGHGLQLAIDQLKRQMSAGTVRNPRPFAHRLIVDYLTEQREGHHGT